MDPDTATNSPVAALMTTSGRWSAGRIHDGYVRIPIPSRRLLTRLENFDLETIHHESRGRVERVRRGWVARIHCSEPSCSPSCARLARTPRTRFHTASLGPWCAWVLAVKADLPAAGPLPDRRPDSDAAGGFAQTSIMRRGMAPWLVESALMCNAGSEAYSVSTGTILELGRLREGRFHADVLWSDTVRLPVNDHSSGRRLSSSRIDGSAEKVIEEYGGFIGWWRVGVGAVGTLRLGVNRRC